jgi:hypothetical protein
MEVKMIQTLIPGISENLVSMWRTTPHEVKVNLNGFVPEQRIYILAEGNYDIMRNNKDPDVFLFKGLWEEAGNLLIAMGREKILPLYPQFSEAFGMADNCLLRPKLIEGIMKWNPNWEQIINNLAGTTFDFGQNKFKVLGYHSMDGSPQRPSVRALCEVVNFLDKSNSRFNSRLQLFDIGTQVKLGTIGLEEVLSCRID